MSAAIIAFPGHQAAAPAPDSAEQRVAELEEWRINYALRRAPEIAGQLAAGNIAFALEVAEAVAGTLRLLDWDRQRPAEHRIREAKRSVMAQRRAEKGAATRHRNREAREAALAALGLALTADGVARVEGGTS